MKTFSANQGFLQLKKSFGQKFLFGHKIFYRSIFFQINICAPTLKTIFLSGDSEKTRFSAVIMLDIRYIYRVNLRVYQTILIIFLRNYNIL